MEKVQQPFELFLELSIGVAGDPVGSREHAIALNLSEW